MREMLPMLAILIAGCAPTFTLELRVTCDMRGDQQLYLDGQALDPDDRGIPYIEVTYPSYNDARGATLTTEPATFATLVPVDACTSACGDQCSAADFVHGELSIWIWDDGIAHWSNYACENEAGAGWAGVTDFGRRCGSSVSNIVP